VISTVSFGLMYDCHHHSCMIAIHCHVLQPYYVYSICLLLQQLISSLFASLPLFFQVHAPSTNCNQVVTSQFTSINTERGAHRIRYCVGHDGDLFCVLLQFVGKVSPFFVMYHHPIYLISSLTKRIGTFGISFSNNQGR